MTDFAIEVQNLVKVHALRIDRRGRARRIAIEAAAYVLFAVVSFFLAIRALRQQ